MSEYSMKVKIRVTYKDTDQMGVVYYSNFFVWFEIARTEHFRELGIVYKEIEKGGLYLPVISASCRYKIPVYYDEIVVVCTAVKHVRRTSLDFSYEIFKGNGPKENSRELDDESVAAGQTTHCFVDKDGRPVRIPEHIRQKLLFTT